MRDHELRHRAVGEMHLRRWPLLPLPCLIVQWVVMVAPADRQAERAMIVERAPPADAAADAAHREGVLGPSIRFAWERHSEGSSLAIFVEDADEQAFIDPATHPALTQALAWAEGLPGEVVRSVRIWLAADEAHVEAAVLPRLEVNPDELVSSRIGGQMRIWSDFRLKEDGFGRLVVAANGADRRDVTRQLQRLQDLGNYRNRALLGLPLARQYWPRLDAVEQRLRALSDRIAGADERDDTILEGLTALSLDLATIDTAMSFRMDATEAYGRLVEERLEQLDEQPIAGFMSLAEFTQRRFRPAMATCAATRHRIERLAGRAEQISSLLRARVETRIENQNAQQLRSMERSIAMQVRLQQLVEGLSVVALSYYFIGLVAFVLGALSDDALGVADEVIIGVITIPVVLIVWTITRTLKNRLLAAPRVRQG